MPDAAGVGSGFAGVVSAAAPIIVEKNRLKRLVAFMNRDVTGMVGY